MSSDSDSEEFFDAEDITPCRNTRKSPSQPQKEFHRLVRSGSEPILKEVSTSKSNDTKEQMKNEAESSQTATVELQHIRKKFRELRQRMQADDEDGYDVNLSPTDSQTSSTDGIYAAVGGSVGKSSHPFKVIEHDTTSIQSISSLGRIGRILSGINNPTATISSQEAQQAAQSLTTISQSSKDSTSVLSEIPNQQLVLSSENILNSVEVCQNKMPENEGSPSRPSILPLQEPDVIASTKSSNNNMLKIEIKQDTASIGPVAPPRKKKKAKQLSSDETTPKEKNEEFPSVIRTLDSPASTIESITREFEHSLDRTRNQYITRTDCEHRSKSEETSRSNTIKSISRDFEHCLDIRAATRGQYVVKPQDEDRSKAEGPSTEELERLEKLKIEFLNDVKKSYHQGSFSTNSIGHSSLGARKIPVGPRYSKERRRSAGDEDLIKQLNMFVRTRTDSGKQLTDIEILEQVTVLNLDTGEKVPLSIAEDKLPQCINPLSLHIMRLTSEYVSNNSLDKEKESDEESVSSKQCSIPQEEDADSVRVLKRTAKLKRFLGSTVKKTMHKAKSIAQEVSHARHKEDVMDIIDEVNPGEQNIKLKASNSHKGPYELENMQHVQELSPAVSEDDTSGGHVGPIWCMKFSACGRLMATAGQDRVLRVWVIKDAYPYFEDMRNKYNAEKVSPTPSQESLCTPHPQPKEDFSKLTVMGCENQELNRHIFVEKPFCTYHGHTSDLLDVSWSKNYFVLSSSMDKTVRLWHISRNECLCCFQHIDFVTAIVFHPRDDRYFLSGSLDGKLRLWNIPDKKVAVWNEVDGQTKLITAANFCQNGKFAVIGTYDGRCIFYNTEQLKYYTQIHVRSTRGRNSIGRKISGIEPMPGGDKILITSNDSRIRLYDLRDLSLSCKYKGYVNVSSQIRANFSHDGKYIVSGSENKDIYVWKTHHDYSKFTSVRRDRNDFWEAIKAHNAVVTCAIFSPDPDSIIRMLDERLGKCAGPPEEEEKEQDPMVEQRTKGCGGHVLISADFNGCIKVFLNRMKPKHSSLPASALV